MLNDRVGNMKNKILLLIIMIIYIFVPILIMFNNNLFNIKFYILTVLGILIFLLMKMFKISNSDLGITKNNLLECIKRNALLIAIFIIIIIILKIIGFDKITPNETIWFYIFYILVSCPIQEFLYRGIFGYFEKNSKYKYLWVIVSSLLYSFVHIIYKDSLTCILTFIIGIIWFLLYRKDYNLTGVCLSHIILGILTISLGIIN